MRILSIATAVVIFACSSTGFSALADGEADQKFFTDNSSTHSAKSIQMNLDTNGTLSSTSAIDTNSNEFQILEMTRKYLTDQVSSVTESESSNRGRGTNQLPLSSITGTLLEVLNGEIPKIEDRRKSWRGTQLEYDWGKVDLLAPRIVVAGIFATMAVIEHTELHYTSGGPTTSYSVKHDLQFVQLDGVWKISNDVIGVLEYSNILEPYHRVILQGTALVSRIAPGLAPAIDPQGIETPESRLRGVIPPAKDSKKIGLIAYRTQAPVSYNGEAAANYAVEWADNKRNRNYPVYENDCTNFASQALRAGGWPDDMDNGWWAYGDLSTSSGIPAVDRRNTGEAWRLAHGLYEYGRNVSHRFRGYEDGRQARRGDIVFADWKKANEEFGTDGHMDHTMVVTGQGNGVDWREVLVSYHTTDRLNIKMGTVAAVRAAGMDPNLQRFYFMSPAG